MDKIARGSRCMSLIVAADSEFGIGKNGTIPWRLRTHPLIRTVYILNFRKDMAHFVACTTKIENENMVNAVIMGRKCWDSIPEKFRPLKGRLNVVISRTLEPMETDNLIISNDFEKIVWNLTEGPLSKRVNRVYNIGGREIYQWALERDLVDQIILTKVHGKFDADVHLGDVDWDKFQENESTKTETLVENGVEFSFHYYDRLAHNVVN